MFPDSAMAFEATRSMLLRIPRVTEAVQWRGMHVYWVMNKRVGGKLFAILNPEPGDGSPVAFAAGPERAPELLEIDGIRPAPHLARAHWVALADWAVLPQRELYPELLAAHAYVSNRLPPRVQRLAELTAREYRLHLRDCRASEQR